MVLPHSEKMVKRSRVVLIVEVQCERTAVLAIGIVALITFGVVVSTDFGIVTLSTCMPKRSRYSRSTRNVEPKIFTCSVRQSSSWLTDRPTLDRHTLVMHTLDKRYIGKYTALVDTLTGPHRS